MAVKVKEKEIAIELRRQGYSYSEILKRVPVAKSTLSLWLRSVGLAKQQKQRLTEKRLAALKRGWEACRKKRILIMSKIKKTLSKK
jgi:transposase